MTVRSQLLSNQLDASHLAAGYLPAADLPVSCPGEWMNEPCKPVFR